MTLSLASSFSQLMRHSSLQMFCTKHVAESQISMQQLHWHVQRAALSQGVAPLKPRQRQLFMCGTEGRAHERTILSKPALLSFVTSLNASAKKLS